MNNEEKKIIGYDPQTGQPIYEEQSQPVVEPTITNSEEVSTEPKKKSKAPIVLIIIGGVLFLGGLCIVLLLLLFGGIFAANSTKTINVPKVQEVEKTFYEETFNIKYTSPWTETNAKLTNGETQKGLKYGDGEIVLLPLGSSALDETTTADFSTSTGRTKLYNEFREYWGKNETLGSGTYGFNILKDDIYYASMEYTRSNSKGRLYLVVSESNNIVLSFMSGVTTEETSADQKVIELLKNINIDTKYDDEMAGYLDKMSNWNMYSSARSGDLGKKKTISGGWRILSNSEEYWTFKDGKFNYYKSYQDLNDNYWEGTYKVYTGKQGASKVGIDSERIDSIVAKGKVKESDIYTLILTPTKIISGGVDKSSTNIHGEELHMVWILIDHGKEGIEGQMLNVKTADTSYYVKVKD